MPRHIERKERRLTWYATLTVPRGVADLGQCSTASQRVADEGVASVVNC